MSFNLFSDHFLPCFTDKLKKTVKFSISVTAKREQCLILFKIYMYVVNEHVIQFTALFKDLISTFCFKFVSIIFRFDSKVIFQVNFLCKF